MYQIKNNYLYYISKELNKTYFLNCIDNSIFEIDEIGTKLIEELLTTKSDKRAQEIILLFEGVDLFERKSTETI